MTAHTHNVPSQPDDSPESRIVDCDDEPKLTDDEWQAIEVLSRRDDA